MSDETQGRLGKLQSDLEVLLRWEASARSLAEARAIISDKIAELEASADPWRDAKGHIKGIERTDVEFPDWQKEVARYVQHIESENARLTARVAELEDENACLHDENARLMTLMVNLEDANPIADMHPPFEGPIVGIEPVLDPARVLATAFEIIGGKTNFLAKPYPLKKGVE